MLPSLGLYISVPFCRGKCTFCNFASGVFSEAKLARYVDLLCAEIRSSRATATSIGAVLPETVDTIYLGGGTPSLLSAAAVRRIFCAIREVFQVSPEAEVTLECAPGQLSDETLAEYLRQGTSRVSLGVQSFVAAESSAVGRLHTPGICAAEIERLRAAGLPDINIDLIAGLPHQTAESWRTSLLRTVELGVPHASIYMLEVDDDSRLGKEILSGGSRYGAGAVPTDDETSEWYGIGCDVLGEAGLAQYEISNFARQGHRSRHNLRYWKRDPYLGFGLDAHSMLTTAAGTPLRFANTDDLDHYFAAADPDAGPLKQLRVTAVRTPAELVQPAQAFEETIFLGLRLNDGLDLQTVTQEFGPELLQTVQAPIDELREHGLLELHSGRMRLTARGREISNEVFSRLLLPSAA